MGDAGLLLEAGEEEVVIQFIEKGVDIGVDDVFVALVMEFAEAGDGAVDSTAGAVGEGAFEELLFEGFRQGTGGGGLEDAVADGGDEEGAGFLGLMFLNDDLE